MANDYGLHDHNEVEALNILTRCRGFKRIADTATHTAGEGDHDDVTEFVMIKAIGGAATFATENAVNGTGDAPANTDTLSQDAELWGRFSAIDLSSGTVYAYYI